MAEIDAGGALRALGGGALAAIVQAIPRRATLGWETFKDWLSASVGLSHEQLHVAIGGPLFVAAARLFGWRLSSFKPLLVVALFEAANELLDYTRYARENWPWQRDETIREVVLTFTVPLAIILVATIVGRVRDQRSRAA